MAEAEDLQSWATKEGLSAQVIRVLQGQGIASLEQIRSSLEAGNIETLQHSDLLNDADCLALKEAVRRLRDSSDHGPRFPTKTEEPQPQSPTNLNAPTPTQQQQGDPSAHCAAMRDLSLSSTSSEKKFTFLLLGKTGSGKSTTGNTIFGEKLFKTSGLFASVTSDCDRAQNCRNGRTIEIIDSPGLYDTKKTHEDVSVTIVKTVAAMHPGPHAIPYVVRLGRYTDEEYGAYKRLKALFDEGITKYMIVLFTHGDTLEQENMSIKKAIECFAPKALKQVLKECGDRYIVFNNMTDNPQPQVENLLSMAKHIVAQNGGKTYSCPKYKKIGQGMEEEVARRLQEFEKKDLQRQKYVQELERQTKEAEEKAAKSRQQMEENEQKRQRQMDKQEESRRKLEEQLQNHIKEQQEQTKQYQEQLQRVQREREEQERMMKQKMSEDEKRRAEEKAEEMKQREKEMQKKMKQQEEEFRNQMVEDEKRRQHMEKERQKLMLKVEEQRRKDKDELEQKEAKIQELMEKIFEEDMRKQAMHDEEMEKLKQSFFVKASEWVSKGIDYVIDKVKTGLDAYFYWQEKEEDEEDEQDEEDED